jgi:hypothetical protein
MAIYESICTKCGNQFTYAKPMEQRNDTPICCEQKTERRIITPPQGFVDTPAAG